jgi:hypothetical protein
MKHLKKFEDIKIPINVGDTVLGGRFKNKKTLVKKIGKNSKGDITINDKPLLKYRIIKESTQDKLKEDVEDYLAHLKDDGFKIEVIDGSNREYERYNIRIWLPKNSENYTYSNMNVFNWSKINEEIERFISIITEEFRLSHLYSVRSSGDGVSFIRDEHYENSKPSINGINNDLKMSSFCIVIYKSTWL